MLCNKSPQISGLKQHAFILSHFLGAGSPSTAQLASARGPTRLWSRRRWAAVSPRDLTGEEQLLKCTWLLALFKDTGASPWVAPASQPAGDIPSRYNLMSPSHLCALCWLQAGTGLTPKRRGSHGVGVQGAGHGSHCVACPAHHGTPRASWSSLAGSPSLELPFKPATEVWPLDPKHVETSPALAEGHRVASHGWPLLLPIAA